MSNAKFMDYVFCDYLSMNKADPKRTIPSGFSLEIPFDQDIIEVPTLCLDVVRRIFNTDSLNLPDILSADLCIDYTFRTFDTDLDKLKKGLSMNFRDNKLWELKVPVKNNPYKKNVYYVTHGMLFDHNMKVCMITSWTLLKQENNYYKVTKRNLKIDSAFFTKREDSVQTYINTNFVKTFTTTTWITPPWINSPRFIRTVATSETNEYGIFTVTDIDYKIKKVHTPDTTVTRDMLVNIVKGNMSDF